MGVQSLLIVDGLNETSPTLANELVARIRNLGLRSPQMAIAIATREEAARFRPVTDHHFEIALPTDGQRRELAQIYEVPQLICEKWDPLLETPLDYKIAGAIADSDHSNNLTNHGFLHAYLALQLQPQSQVCFSVLVQIAGLLSSRLSWSLPEAEFDRLSAEMSADPAISHLLFDRRVLASSSHRITFWHERFKQFFESEYLISKHRTPDELATACCRPRFRDAFPLVLSAVTDTQTLRECLGEVRSPDLLAKALRGDLGPHPRAATREWAKDLFRRARDEVRRLELEPAAEAAIGYPGGTPREPEPWSSADLLLFEALRAHLRSGEFLSEYWELLIASEAKYLEKLDGMGIPKKSSSHIALCNLVVLMSSGALAVNHINPGPRHSGTADWSKNAQQTLFSLLSAPDKLSPVQLYILCGICRELLGADEAPVLSELPGLLRFAISAGLYHVTLEAAYLAGFASHWIKGEQREEVKVILESCLGKNPMLNSAVFEALTRFTEIDVGVTSETALEEIQSLLRESKTPEGNERAAHAFDGQFEEIYQGAYWDAVHDLEPDEYREFLIRAGLGMSPLSLFVSSVLSRLIDLRSPAAQPVFERWATPPEQPSMINSELGTVFLAAHIGLAQLRVPLPSSNPTSDPDREAWSEWGRVFYWLHRDDLDPTEAVLRARSHVRCLATQHLRHSIDPWYWLQKKMVQQLSPDFSHADVEEVFPREIKNLLEDALRESETLTSLFSYPHQSSDRTRTMIEALGRLGDESTAVFLEQFADSRELGPTTIEAIRSIRERQP